MFISHKIYPVREKVLHVRLHVPKKTRTFFKDQELSKKTIVFVKTSRPEKLEELSENFKVFRKVHYSFYNSTQFPYIFHQPWIGFILDFNLSLNRKNTLILFVKRIIAIKQ